MERTDPMSIRQIIDQVIDRSAGRDEFLGQKASALWPDIVGPGVNRLTTRRYFRDGVLHVYLSSPVLKNELSFRTTAIAEAINSALGTDTVKKIAIH